MAEKIVIPAHAIEVDEQGRVVITNEQASAAIKSALESMSAEERKSANFEADSNSSCSNTLAYCG